MLDAETQRRLTLIEPILYGDVFDCPVTLDEVHRFCRLPIARDELRRELAEDRLIVRVVAEVDGLYVLRGREPLVERRRRRKPEAARSVARARAVMGLVKYLPFVRGGLLTGSAAAGGGAVGDDLDYLVLVAPGRLWLVFGILGGLQRLGLARILCANYYLALDHLGLSKRTPFIARELIQARPLAGGAAIEQLWSQNAWVFDVFPNAKPPHEPNAPTPDERTGVVGRCANRVEQLLDGAAGDGLDALCRRAFGHRLKAHYRKHRRDLPDGVRDRAWRGQELRFHANDHQPLIAEALAARRTRAWQLLAAPATKEGHASR